MPNLSLKRRPLFSSGSGWHKTGMMTGPGATILSILVLAAFALVAGGLYLLIKRKERKQGVLMLIAAAVLFGNVLVWTI